MYWLILLAVRLLKDDGSLRHGEVGGDGKTWGLYKIWVLD